MRVAFRVDAAVQIGTGHMMRCLSLADVLRSRGSECHFICRRGLGDLADLIRSRGHAVHDLPGAAVAAPEDGWRPDAMQTRNILDRLQPQWLVIDQYRLDAEWECEVAGSVQKLFVIDDIGRRHQCDLLLDQNFNNPMHQRYRSSLSADTPLLLGPHFALVQPQFAALRPRALERRHGALSHLIVSMGGTDPGNETSKVLDGLRMCEQGPWTIDVVIGGANPHAKSIEGACRSLRHATMHVQTPNMAELMVAADCAITAGGSITWERCCLGLPALVTVISEDQAAIAESVATAGAQNLLGRDAQVSPGDYAKALLALTAEELRAMAAAAARLCDGRGADRVADWLH